MSGLVTKLKYLLSSIVLHKSLTTYIIFLVAYKKPYYPSAKRLAHAPAMGPPFLLPRHVADI